MARVPCEVEEIVLTGDHGGDVPSVRVTCSQCGDCQESYGTSEKSVKRCLVMLRENCEEEDADNFYEAEDDENDYG